MLPGRVLLGEALLHLEAGQALPAAVADLAQAVAVHRGEAVRLGQDGGRLHGAAQRAAIDGADAVVGEALGQPSNLHAALVGEVHPHRPREAVLRRELGGPVAHEVEARGHGSGRGRGSGVAARGHLDRGLPRGARHLRPGEALPGRVVP